VVKILNESAIDSATLNPVIRRQVHRHVGPKLTKDGITVRVYHGRKHCKQIGGRAWRSRGFISIVIPPRLFLVARDWELHAPRFAQVVAVLAARYSGRHALLEQTFAAATPATIDEFAAAAEVPFALRAGNGPMLAMEARLEFIVIERRRHEQTMNKARQKYQRYRNWEKQLRHRLRKLGSQV
jgi:hypothetical protein